MSKVWVKGKKKIKDLGHQMVVKHKMVMVGGKTLTSH